MTLDALIDRVATPDEPSAPAIMDARGRVVATRGALGDRVRAYAGAFARAGIAAGDPVAFGVRQDADGIAWLLGALRAGIVVVVLDPGVRPSLLAAQCRAAGVRAVVMDGGVATLAGSSVMRWAAARRRRTAPGPDDARAVDLGDVTSARRESSASTASRAATRAGRSTTAPPRSSCSRPGRPARPGRRPLAGGLAATLEQGAALVELGPGDRVLGTGLHLVGPALLAGATVVLPPGRGGTDALARTTREARVTHVSLPLHRATAWAAAGGAGAALRVLLLGSAPVRNAALRPLSSSLPGVRVASIYGMTEHLLVALVGADERLAFDERDGDLVGTPLPGVRLRTDDRGELHVAGPALARGYLGEPRASMELPTGDLGAARRGRAASCFVAGGRRCSSAAARTSTRRCTSPRSRRRPGSTPPSWLASSDPTATRRSSCSPSHATVTTRSRRAAGWSRSPVPRHRPSTRMPGRTSSSPSASCRVPGAPDKPDRAALAAVAAAQLDGGGADADRRHGRHRVRRRRRRALARGRGPRRPRPRQGRGTDALGWRIRPMGPRRPRAVAAGAPRLRGRRPCRRARLAVGTPTRRSSRRQCAARPG